MFITSSTPKKKKSNAKRALRGKPFQPRLLLTDSIKVALSAEEENILMSQNENQQRKYDRFWGIDEDARLCFLENDSMNVEDQCSRSSYEFCIQETQRHIWRQEFLTNFRGDRDGAHYDLGPTTISNYMAKFYSLLDR
jgi:hypothetical protein